DKGAGLSNVLLQLQDEIGLAILRNKGVEQCKARLVHPRELRAQELFKLAQRRVASRGACSGTNPEHWMHTARAVALKKIAQFLHLCGDLLSHVPCTPHIVLRPIPGEQYDCETPLYPRAKYARMGC